MLGNSFLFWFDGQTLIEFAQAANSDGNLKEAIWMIDAVCQREKIVEQMTEEEHSVLVQTVIDVLDQEESRKSIKSIEKVLK